MIHVMRVLLQLLLVLPVTVSVAATGIGGPVFQLSPFNVEESRIDDNELNLGIGYYEAGNPDLTAVSLGEILEAGPGVTMQRRGSGSIEPNLRGFNLDRVTVSFNGLMMPVASPTRTASPVNFFSAGGISEVMVVTAFPSVTHGPVPVGGRIAIRTDASRSIQDKLNIGISSNPAGGRISAIGNLIRGDRLSLQAGIHYVDLDSFESGSPGLEVDEKYRGWGVSSALAFQQENGNRLDVAVNFFRQIEARNTSLPLDSKDSDAVHVSAGYIVDLKDAELELSIGYSETTPYLTSENRFIPAAAPIAGIVAGSMAKSSSLKIGYKRNIWKASTIEVGLDNAIQTRDAARVRSLKSGAVIEDTIWPDVEASHPGCYIELISDRDADFEWRIGARIGESTTEAKATNNPVKAIPGAKGPTVIDNFVAYNGDEASRIKATDWTSGANAIGQWWLSERFNLMFGAGVTVAPPGIGERYRAFLSALGGGVELGNPALDPETKKSISIGMAYTSASMSFKSEIWYADIEDYVTRMAVSSTPLVYSFRNHDATFKGMDLQLMWRPFDREQLEAFKIEAAFSMVNGRNQVTGKDVVEVPPWDLSFGLIWDQQIRYGDLSLKLSGSYVDSASNPDPGLNPIYRDTAAWFRLNASVALRRENWLVRVVCENALDRLGYAYLQPPVATGPILPARGDLSPGDRIPLPGRSISLQISYFY